MVCVDKVISKKKRAAQAHDGDGYEPKTFDHAGQTTGPAADRDFKFEEVSQIFPNCFSELFSIGKLMVKHGFILVTKAPDPMNEDGEC